LPKSLREHLRQVRTSQKLTQGDVARLIGTNTETYQHWEKGYTEPEIESIPSIVRFLGYDPYPAPTNLQERMLSKRRRMGWTLNVAAKLFKVNRKTWKAWEQGGAPSIKFENPLEMFLEGHSD